MHLFRAQRNTSLLEKLQCVKADDGRAFVIQHAAAYEIAVTLAQLETWNMEQRLSQLIPTEALFSSLPVVSPPAFYDRLIGNGQAVLTTKLRLAPTVGQRYRLCHADGQFFALGEVVETTDGPALKAIKTFVLSPST